MRLFLLLILAGGAQLGYSQTANFTATVTGGCSPLIVNFIDQSTGAVSWNWNFGNGNTSTQQNPGTTYFNPGVYTVTLTVRNAAGASNTITKTSYITVNPTPVINMTANPTTGCIPLTVNFTNQISTSSGSITSLQWDFGDGIASTAASPSHTYTNSGTFDVTLSATNSHGCRNTRVFSNIINIGVTPVANFSNSAPPACTVPATVNFTNSS